FGACAAPATTAPAVTEKLEIFEHNLHPAALLLCVLVFPLVEPQTAFDEQWAPFGAILRDRLALLTPRLDVDVDHLFPAFAGLHLELTVDRQRELANRRAFRRNAQLGIAREIPHQQDFVERRHGSLAKDYETTGRQTTGLKPADLARRLFSPARET